ncbi:MAG TPA: response regulator [Gaiellaceae bacterium]|nr:response regulator [Gaiellaceae bacterium]
MQASRPRALVVDDDEALRMLIRVNLELDGFEVAEAATLADAERAARESQCDVVLLDVHLGHDESDGLLALLRSRGVPVVLVTGSSDADLYRDRADAVLTKPFEPQALVNLARRLARVEA